MRRNKSILPAVVLAVGLLGVVASVSWACTPQAVVSVVPEKGVAGNIVTVSGEGFSTVPVELRWADEDGPVFAAGVGPQFSSQATIPSDAVPGHYFLMVGKRAVTVFEVTAGSGFGNNATLASSSAQADLWGGFENGEGSGGTLIGNGHPVSGDQSGALASGMVLAAVGSLAAGTAVVAARGKKSKYSSKAPSQRRGNEKSP